MCGTATLPPTGQVVETLRPDRIGNRAPALMKPTQAHPGMTLPVLAKGDHETVLTGMTWGFDAGQRYNARSETAAISTYWSRWYDSRCVIPLLRFYEGGRWFTSSDDIMLAAGIWRAVKYANPAGVWWDTEVVVLTQQAIGDVALYHSRQPVMIPSQSYIANWLNAEIDTDFLVKSKPTTAVLAA